VRTTNSVGRGGTNRKTLSNIGVWIHTWNTVGRDGTQRKQMWNTSAWNYTYVASVATTVLMLSDSTSENNVDFLSVGFANKPHKVWNKYAHKHTHKNESLHTYRGPRRDTTTNIVKHGYFKSHVCTMRLAEPLPVGILRNEFHGVGKIMVLRVFGCRTLVECRKVSYGTNGTGVVEVSWSVAFLCVLGLHSSSVVKCHIFVWLGADFCVCLWCRKAEVT